MSSYKDLPSDIEKYSLSPYLSGKDIASLSLVDRKRRDLYDLKYWEKRLLSEEGIDLPNYEDGSSPYTRYSKAKLYLKGKKLFNKKKISQHSFMGILPIIFRFMVKYGSPSQIEEDYTSDHIYPYEEAFHIISEYGSIPMINRFLPEKLDKIVRYAFSEGRTDIIDYLGYSKYDIMNILLRTSNYGGRESLDRILKYASTLSGKVGVIGWKDKDGTYLLSLDKTFMINYIKELGLTDLLPSNDFTIHYSYVPPEDYPLPLKYLLK